MTTHRVEPGGLHSALATCQQGDEIVLAPGIHPPVSGPRREDADSWTVPVVVRAEQGAFLTRLSLWQSHVVLDRLRWVENPAETSDKDCSLLYVFNSASHIDVIEPDIDGAGVMIRGHHVRILGGDISGLRADGQPARFQVDGINIGDEATDVIVDGTAVHDFPDRPGKLHIDGIQIFDCKRVVIRGVRADRIGNAALILSGGRQLGLEDVVITGCLFNGTVTASEPSATRVVLTDSEIGNLRMDQAQPDALPGLVADRLMIRYLGEKHSYPTNSVILATNPGFGHHPALADPSLGNRRSANEPITLVAPRPPVNEWAAQWLGEDVPTEPIPTPDPPVEPEPPVDPQPQPEPGPDVPEPGPDVPAPPVEPEPEPEPPTGDDALRQAIAEALAPVNDRIDVAFRALAGLAEQNATLSRRLRDHAETVGAHGDDLATLARQMRQVEADHKRAVAAVTAAAAAFRAEL